MEYTENNSFVFLLRFYVNQTIHSHNHVIIYDVCRRDETAAARRRFLENINEASVVFYTKELKYKQQ